MIQGLQVPVSLPCNEDMDSSSSATLADFILSASLQISLLSLNAPRNFKDELFDIHSMHLLYL